MSKILKVSRPSDYGSWVGHTDRHPLVSVIDYCEVSPIRHSLNDYDVYGVFLRDDDRLASGMSISEAAYDLGFEYPQHFSRMFKKATGLTPQEYIRQRNK